MIEVMAETLELKNIDANALNDLIRRIEDIENSCAIVAEKMGQLYMRADEHNVALLTTLLDKPMRDVFNNQQAFAEILNELRMRACTVPG